MKKLQSAAGGRKKNSPDAVFSSSFFPFYPWAALKRKRSDGRVLCSRPADRAAPAGPARCGSWWRGRKVSQCDCAARRRSRTTECSRFKGTFHVQLVLLWSLSGPAEAVCPAPAVIVRPAEIEASALPVQLIGRFHVYLHSRQEVAPPSWEPIMSLHLSLALARKIIQTCCYVLHMYCIDF